MHLDSAETVRRAMLDAAVSAYEDAGLSGLCADGRWEAAVDAMRSVAAVATERSAVDLAAPVARAVTVVAGTTAPPPSGGSVAAAAGALAAALTQMVAGLTAGRPRYADVAEEMRDAGHRAAALATELLALVRRDAAAVEAVAAAYRLPRTPAGVAADRADAIDRAMYDATEAPADIARAAAAVAELAATIAERGNRNAVADAAVAALLADAVCRASALTVRVNVPALRDPSAGRRLERAADGFAQAAKASAERAVAAAGR
jgi:formiminotetrahydrofolate cyclodeaminase